jgi:ribosomal RNA-processing protein 17
LDDAEPTNEETEYIDEEKYTTVTVTEVDVTRTGLEEEPTGQAEEPVEEPVVEPVKNGRKPRPQKPKVKKKKFRYLNKADRKVERVKQRTGGRKAKSKRTE